VSFSFSAGLDFQKSNLRRMKSVQGCQPALYVIDLFVEHRVQTNGTLPKPERPKTKSVSGKTQRAIGRDSLTNALAIRGLAHLDADTKQEKREIAMTVANPTAEQQAELLDYCANDTTATEALFRYMVERGQIDWPRALWRGRYLDARRPALGHAWPLTVFWHSLARASRAYWLLYRCCSSDH
jgi:hypothetical protein